jgi:hypothetical protein
MAQKRIFQISTPRGKLYQKKSCSGSVTAHLEWAPDFGKRKAKGFSEAQQFVDSECLRYMDPMTPRRTGYMIKSAQLGTVIGSAEIEYLAPYARKQYYEHNGDNGNRGKLWFERMKTAKGETIRKGAEKIIANN